MLQSLHTAALFALFLYAIGQVSCVGRKHTTNRYRSNHSDLDPDASIRALVRAIPHWNATLLVLFSFSFLLGLVLSDNAQGIFESDSDECVPCHGTVL